MTLTKAFHVVIIIELISLLKTELCTGELLNTNITQNGKVNGMYE